jgi:hypothetical protein
MVVASETTIEDVPPIIVSPATPMATIPAAKDHADTVPPVQVANDFH